MEVQVNYLAVILAMLSSMAVGSIWYAQSVFGKTWAKLAKIDMSKNRGNVAQPIAVAAAVSLLTAYVLAYVAYLSNYYFQNSFLADSLNSAFWLWLGFAAARFTMHDQFEGRPAKLTAINVGHEFVAIMLMGLIIGLMGA